jgi:TPR repeat protein
MRNLIILPVLLLTLLVGTPAFSADLQKGLEAHSKGDYATVLREWTPLAKQGNVRAQFNLGVMYAKGDGVPQDDKTAVKWFRLAAEQGNADAQVNLGWMYFEGKGVPKYYKTAVKWYRLAAEQGDARAQFYLGLMYSKGQGVSQDYKTAAKWFRKSAEQGFAEARNILGWMHHKGLGVPQNKVFARIWYGLAAGQGNADAEYNLGLLYAKGDGVPQDDKTAVVYFRLAAEQGIARAQRDLGLMYFEGKGVPQDNVYAHMWYDVAASSGDKNVTELAVKNRDDAAKRMTEAEISKANELARRCIENRYKNCEQSGLQKGLTAFESGDYSTALSEWTPLAEQGNADAQFYLGLMYENGTGVPKDYKTAVKWFRLAAEQGNAYAQFNLGLMYFEGKGVPQDNVYAHMWYDVAASSGDKNVTELAVKNRDDAAKRMTEAEISKANELARRCIENRYKNCERSVQPSPPAIAKKTDPDKVVSASSGSGFAVSDSGHVITNYHVIEGCQKVKIHHNGKTIPAIAVTFDPQNDLALLKGDFRPSTVLSLSTKSPELLQDVYVAGFPFGRKVSTGVKVTKGIISSLTGIGNNFSNIQIDAALQPGNSGGPILDDTGNVVGVAVARLDKVKTLKTLGSLPENTNFGIKTSVVRSILDSRNISSRKPNTASISKTKLGKMISDGTYYLSCWMSTAQIEKMRSKKVIFQNLD